MTKEEKSTPLISENQLETNLEKLLWNAWQKCINENKELRILVNDLQSKVDSLISNASQNSGSNENESSNSNLKPQRKKYSPVNSDEEEEIVAKETEWLISRHKKRKAVSSPEETKNPETKDKNHNTKNVTRNVKPPPIILSKVKDYNKIIQELKVKNIKPKVVMMTDQQLKFNVDTESEYRELSKHLNGSSLEWHTYENKLTRPIRVVVKGLHPTCDPDEIKEELKNMKFKIIDVVNKIKKTKVNDKEIITALPLFMLTFDNSEDIKEIYNIQYLCHMRVKIEALRSNKLIPQCKKCQKYGHTHKYCQRQAKCVKCAGDHRTADCKKPSDTPPKCANCLEAHPANYRGCLIAKELQNKRNSSVKSKRTFTSRRTVETSTYAQVTREPQPSQSNEPFASKQEQQQQLPVQIDIISNMMQMIQNIMTSIGEISQRLDRLDASNSSTVSVFKTK